MKANSASPELTTLHVLGGGHEFWVDEAEGVNKADQDALIHYLLNYSPPWQK